MKSAAAKIFFPLLILALDLSASAQTKLESLDDYLAQAFSAGQQEQRAALFHIGIQGQQRENGFLVTAVLEGYPAFIAGLYRGDLIIAADGKPFEPISSFSGAKEPTITLDIKRGDAELSVEVSPIFENLYDSYRTATVNSIQEFSAGNKVIGYLRLWALSKNTADLTTFAQLMKRLDHCDALILDLRNAYGYVDQLHTDSLLINDRGVDYFEKSVVVLFNQQTASPPMELIKSIQQLQRIDTLSDQAHEGVMPEVTIEYPLEQPSRFDPQYDAALNKLLGII